jgi:hypothetical protein
MTFLWCALLEEFLVQENCFNLPRVRKITVGKRADIIRLTGPSVDVAMADGGCLPTRVLFGFLFFFSANSDVVQKCYVGLNADGQRPLSDGRWPWATATETERRPTTEDRMLKKSGWLGRL